ncbi:uncharacterized, partial [Tachysurus ichikawai]
QKVQRELDRLAASLALCVRVPHQRLLLHSHNSQRHTGSLESPWGSRVMAFTSSHSVQPCSTGVGFLPLDLKLPLCGMTSVHITYLRVILHSSQTSIITPDLFILLHQLVYIEGTQDSPELNYTVVFNNSLSFIVTGICSCLFSDL